MEADAKLAAVYAEEGQREFDAGAWDAAAVAFTWALAYAPRDARTAELRARACARRATVAIDEVRRLLDARRWLDALRELEALPEAPAATRALLRGICLFELDRDDEADDALGLAMKDPAHEREARTLRALLALRRGANRAAEAELRALEAGGLSTPLTSLLRQASRGGRLLLRGSVFGGVDSNPELAPGLALSDGSPDGFLAATALAQWTPLGPVSPLARVALGAREYAQHPKQRTANVVGSLGGQLGRGGNRVALDYSLEAGLFGATPWSVAHGPRVEGSLQLRPVLLFASWTLRFQRFLPDDVAAFSGLRQDVEAGTWVALPAGFAVELAWELVRDEASLTELSSLEHGPRLVVGWQRGPVRVGASGTLDWRAYDARDADLGVQRADRRFRGGLRVDVDLVSWLGLFVMGDASVVESNVSSVTSVRLTASAGAQLYAGVF